MVIVSCFNFFVVFSVKFLLLVCKYLIRSSACDVEQNTDEEEPDESQGGVLPLEDGRYIYNMSILILSAC
jgi:hypothetical protein